MITDELEFLQLVSKNKVMAALKSYADTLLFYYLGHMACQRSAGDILEIGVGGSSYALRELSQKEHKTFFAIDADQSRLKDFVLDDRFFPAAICQGLNINSHTLASRDLPHMCYVHIDGNKSQVSTVNDLVYSMNNLSPMGMICQDDYGNNKWPTITHAVHDLMIKKSFTFLVIGDSSAWLVRQQDHAAWLDILDKDPELQLLGRFVNLADSFQSLDCYNRYFFINYFKNAFANDDRTNSQHQIYFDRLFDCDSQHYLKMPYSIQSQVGRAVDRKIWFKRLLRWGS